MGAVTTDIGKVERLRLTSGRAYLGARLLGTVVVHLPRGVYESGFRASADQAQTDHRSARMSTTERRVDVIADGGTIEQRYI